jgi:hypothetical protein
MVVRCPPALSSAPVLTPDERAQAMEILTDQAEELIDLTRDADQAMVDRVVCMSPLRLLAPDAPPGLVEIYVDALEGQGAPAAGLLEAIAALAPPALSQYARAARERLDGSPAARQPIRATEALALRLAGADAYLLRIERSGPAWHAAHVIVEGEADDAVLSVASMSDAEPGAELTDLVKDLDVTGIAAIERADLDDLRSRVALATANARRVQAGLNTETVVTLPLVGAALGVAPEVVCGLVVGGGASPLVVEPDDDDRFAALSDDLLEDFGAWLAQADRPVRAGLLTAELMLTYKWSEGDGDLARWTEPDLAQFLLDYLPREVFVDDRMLRELPPAISDFLGFLDHRELLAGEQLAALLDACEDLTDPFADAVADAPATGPADLLVQAMAADGVDLSDEAQVQAWIAAYNAGSQADRERITGPPRSRRAKGARRRSTKAARKANRRRH